jgi:hypothetical protein
MALVREGMYIPWLSDKWHHASDIKNLFEVKVCTTRENLMINAICQTPSGMYIPMLSDDRRHQSQTKNVL